jgi:hypothetical protein
VGHRLWVVGTEITRGPDRSEDRDGLEPYGGLAS